MTREQLTDTRWKIFCGLDSYMKAVCKGTEYYKQWQLWFNCVVHLCNISKDEIIFLEGIKVFDEILSKLIEEEGTAEEVSGDEVDEYEHKKCIMRLKERKARKEKETINALQPCEDAISRQAVNKLQKYRYNCGDMAITCVSLNSINELPPVTPAEKHKSYDDMISRQAVLNLPRIALKNGFGEITAAIYIKDIEKLPPTAEKVEYNDPAQVELTGDGYADGQIVYEWGKCPNCGWEFEDGDKDWEEPYCCHCGQKLHWFETQEVEE